LARVGEVAKEIGKGGLIIMNLCGRGDKDVFTIADALGAKLA
jgi:tryptophan synthase beta chain